MDQNKVSEHLEKIHQIKVEEDIARLFICGECSYKTAKMNELKDHIISVHKKEQHNWMAENIESAFVCVECDNLFETKSMLTKHLETQCDHTFLKTIKGGGITNDVSQDDNTEIEIIEDSENDDDVSEDSADEGEDIEIEYTPIKGKKDEQDGANIKGDSDEFKDASLKLKHMMEQKGKRYSVWGREVHITSVRRGGAAVTITVEVKTKNGVAGKANLMIYSKGSMRITKKRGEDVRYVKSLSEFIVRPIMKKLMSGEINEAFLKNMETKVLNKKAKKSVVTSPKPVKRLLEKPGKKYANSVCKICSKIFTTVAEVKNHMQIHE